MVLLAVSGSITLPAKRIPQPEPLSPEGASFSRLELTRCINWLPTGTVKIPLQRKGFTRPERVTLDTAQTQSLLRPRRQGPHRLLLAAGIFHVDYRFNKHKSVVCNGLFLIFMGTLLAVSRSNNLTTTTHRQPEKQLQVPQSLKP